MSTTPEPPQDGTDARTRGSMRQVSGELAAHGVAADADAAGVDLRLALEHADGAARGDEHDEPVAVAGRDYGVEGELVGRERRPAVDRVALRGMGGVEVAPVGLRAVVFAAGAAEIELLPPQLSESPA
ncbi:MAG: hypothetical protein U1G05_18020 [Kiritimatiellia bacterium]